MEIHKSIPALPKYPKSLAEGFKHEAQLLPKLGDAPRAFLESPHLEGFLHIPNFMHLNIPREFNGADPTGEAACGKEPLMYFRRKNNGCTKKGVTQWEFHPGAAPGSDLRPCGERNPPEAGLVGGLGIPWEGTQPGAVPE